LANPVGAVNPQQLQAILQNPWISDVQKQAVLTMMQNRLTPQMIEMPGIGKMMYNPADPSQHVLFPEAHKAGIKTGTTDIGTMSVYDQNTGQYRTQMLLPNQPAGGAAGATTGGGNPPPGGQQQGNIDWTLPGLLELEQRQRAAVKGAEETSSKLAQARAAPLTGAMEKASQSAKSLSILDTLENVEKLPDTKNIHTGPFADEWLSVGRALNDFTGLEVFNKNTLSSAEMIKKLGTQLASRVFSR
jgi:hypothetical protein